MHINAEARQGVVLQTYHSSNTMQLVYFKLPASEHGHQEFLTDLVSSHALRIVTPTEWLHWKDFLLRILRQELHNSIRSKLSSLSIPSRTLPGRASATLWDVLQRFCQMEETSFRSILIALMEHLDYPSLRKLPSLDSHDDERWEARDALFACPKAMQAEFILCAIIEACPGTSEQRMTVSALEAFQFPQRITSTSTDRPTSETRLAQKLQGIQCKLMLLGVMVVAPPCMSEGGK